VAQVQLLDDGARALLRGTGLLDQSPLSSRRAFDAITDVLRSSEGAAIVSACAAYGNRNDIIGSDGPWILTAALEFWNKLMNERSRREAVGGDALAGFEMVASQYKDVLQQDQLRSLEEEGALIALKMYESGSDSWQCAELLGRHIP